MSPIGKRFRYRHAHSARKMHPLGIVAICLAVAIVVTVVVGNLLNIFLDDEAYRALTDGQEVETGGESLEKSSVRNVNAYPFTLGGDTEEIAGQASASVSINRADGVLNYTSALASHFGRNSDCRSL